MITTSVAQNGAANGRFPRVELAGAVITITLVRPVPLMRGATMTHSKGRL